MITKTALRKVFNGPFTTKKEIMEKTGYKDPRSVADLVRGLEKVLNTRYFTDDVIDRILATLEIDGGEW